MRPWIAFAAGCVVGCVAAPFVYPNLVQKFAMTTRSKAELDIRAIEQAIQQYAVLNGGRFPSTLQPLVTPDVNGRTFLGSTQAPKDPWGRSYLYEPPGPGHPRPSIRSLGMDGRLGGEGDDADIENLSSAAPK